MGAMLLHDPGSVLRCPDRGKAIPGHPNTGSLRSQFRAGTTLTREPKHRAHGALLPDVGAGIGEKENTAMNENKKGGHWPPFISITCSTYFMR